MTPFDEARARELVRTADCSDDPVDGCFARGRCWAKTADCQRNYRLLANWSVPPAREQGGGQGEGAADAECTGVAAKWCPIHGDCECIEPDDLEEPVRDDACPLHSPVSTHAEGPPPPDPQEQLATLRAEVAGLREVRDAAEAFWNSPPPGPLPNEMVGPWAALGSALGRLGARLDAARGGK